MMLEHQFIAEVGNWQEILAPIFEEIIQGDINRAGEAEIALDIIKRTRSKECYDAYEHLYRNVLSVGNTYQELKARGLDKRPDSSQDGSAG